METTFTYLGPSGGLGGNHFSDGQVCGEFSSDDRRLLELRIRSGTLIDAIKTVYVNVLNHKIESDQHGGTGGNLSTFTLAPDEYITRISGKHGTLIDSLLVVTNKGRSKRWGGTGGTRNFIYNAPPETCIHGFWGYSGTLLDSLGVIIKPLTHLTNTSPSARASEVPFKLEPVRARPSIRSSDRNTISGQLTGNRHLVKKVGFRSKDTGSVRRSVTVDSNGRFSITNIPNGLYEVYLITGGKFEVFSEPKYHNVRCTGNQSIVVNFNVKGVDEG